MTPYFICNHYISDEIDWNLNFNNLIKGNDLLKNQNFHKIKNYDIIQCQFKLFNYFCNKILPKIKKKIILITSQYNLPQIKKSKQTDNLLKNNKIILWISQNPIYLNHPKYMAFPYGIQHYSVKNYYNFLKSNNLAKNINVSNSFVHVHQHLPENHIRCKYPILGTESGPKLEYDDYLRKIANSEFLISTSGDRDDCHRHYEAIGLGTVPISNINYTEIFGNNMYTTNEKNIVKIAESKKCDKKYWKPDKNIIYLEYWKKKMYDRIEKIKKTSEPYQNAPSPSGDNMYHQYTQYIKKQYTSTTIRIIIQITSCLQFRVRAC